MFNRKRPQNQQNNFMIYRLRSPFTGVGHIFSNDNNW